MAEGELSSKGIEQEDRVTHLIDLTDGDKESYGALKAEVEKSNGIVRVLVHPRFNPLGNVNPLTDEYMQQLDGFCELS